METVWFILVSFMLTMYVILDGFDLGAGIIHLYAAKTDAERRLVLNAIGPVWDGNEVWIIAAGGTLYFAFPLVYASSFSGFYLPLIMILWLLMSRGLSIEFRHQVNNPLWRNFWDVVFSVSSGLLVLFLGAALGNVIRGVPLSNDGYFFEPLWTTFMVAPESGVLDWYTVILGLCALFTLTVHGSTYIAMKTNGDVQIRSRTAASKAWWGVLATTIAGVVSTITLRPALFSNFMNHSWGFIFPLAALVGLFGVVYHLRRGKDTSMFLSSTLFILGMLGGTAFALYPNLLTSSIEHSASLTIYNTAAQPYGLTVGLTWWIVGMVLVSGYIVYVYRSFRGKVTLPSEDAGY
jgi:cytochrome bd ubiquinol oxidase subunit II